VKLYVAILCHIAKHRLQTYRTYTTERPTETLLIAVAHCWCGRKGISTAEVVGEGEAMYSYPDEEAPAPRWLH
jgi:hypothetical protein